MAADRSRRPADPRTSADDRETLDGRCWALGLTEPFAAMLTDGGIIYGTTPTVTEPMSHVAPRAPVTSDDVTDRRRVFGATTANWDTDMTVAFRTQNTTVRDSLADRGVNANYLVGRMQHNANRSVVATDPVVDLRPLQWCVRNRKG